MKLRRVLVIAVSLATALVVPAAAQSGSRRLGEQAELYLRDAAGDVWRLEEYGGTLYFVSTTPRPKKPGDPLLALQQALGSHRLDAAEFKQGRLRLIVGLHHVGYVAAIDSFTPPLLSVQDEPGSTTTWRVRSLPDNQIQLENTGEDVSRGWLSMAATGRVRPARLLSGKEPEPVFEYRDAVMVKTPQHTLYLSEVRHVTFVAGERTRADFPPSFVIATSPSGKTWLRVEGEPGSLTIQLVSKDGPIGKPILLNPRRITALAIGHDDVTVAAGVGGIDSGVVRAWNARTGQDLDVIIAKPWGGGPIVNLAFSDDDKKVHGSVGRAASK